MELKSPFNSYHMWNSGWVMEWDIFYQWLAFQCSVNSFHNFCGYGVSWVYMAKEFFTFTTCVSYILMPLQTLQCF